MLAKRASRVPERGFLLIPTPPLTFNQFVYNDVMGKKVSEDVRKFLSRAGKKGGTQTAKTHDMAKIANVRWDAVRSLKK